MEEFNIYLGAKKVKYFEIYVPQDLLKYLNTRGEFDHENVTLKYSGSPKVGKTPNGVLLQFECSYTEFENQSDVSLIEKNISTIKKALKKLQERVRNPSLEFVIPSEAFDLKKGYICHNGISIMCDRSFIPCFGCPQKHCLYINRPGKWTLKKNTESSVFVNSKRALENEEKILEAVNGLNVYITRNVNFLNQLYFQKVR